MKVTATASVGQQSGKAFQSQQAFRVLSSLGQPGHRGRRRRKGLGRRAATRSAVRDTDRRPTRPDRRPGAAQRDPCVTGCRNKS